MKKILQNYLDYNYYYVKLKKGNKFLGNEHNEKLTVNIFYLMVAIGLPLAFYNGSLIFGSNPANLRIFKIICFAIMILSSFFLPIFFQRIPINTKKTVFEINKNAYLLFSNFGLILILIEVISFLIMIKFQ